MVVITGTAVGLGMIGGRGGSMLVLMDGVQFGPPFLHSVGFGAALTPMAFRHSSAMAPAFMIDATIFVVFGLRKRV